MGYKDITVGERVAKAKVMRFVQPGANPGFEVEFEFIEPTTGIPERLTWVGWLSDAAYDNTMEKFWTVLGYNDSEETNGESVFTDPKVLDFNREVKITIDKEARKKKNEQGQLVAALDKDGKQIMDTKIKWVNSMGGNHFKGVAPESTKGVFASLNFSKRNAALKASLGIKSGGSQPPKFNTKEEVPF